MEHIDFALIGGGWRAEFYARIAKAVPERFHITGVLVRRQEMADKWEKEFGIKAVYDLSSLMATKPQFVVLSISKPAIADELCTLMRAGIPVLCETTPAITEAGLYQVWECYRNSNVLIQVAEQYPFHPYFAAWSNAKHLLGDISCMNISAVHSYHAASLIRLFLGVGYETVTLVGNRFRFPVCKTGGRQGMCYTGEETEAVRNRVDFVFENGKTAFFDFTVEQYNSRIRAKHFNLQGNRGEIDDLTIRFVNENGDSVHGAQRRLDMGVYDNLEWSHFGIEVNGQFLYKSPYPTARLNDDELAVAECLCRMAESLRTGVMTGYSLAEGLQDAYLAIEMEKALTHPYQQIVSEKQPWNQ